MNILYKRRYAEKYNVLDINEVRNRLNKINVTNYQL